MNQINSKTEKVVTGSDNLSEIVRILSKEVKQEDDNLYRILLCGLSSFTQTPLNMRILAPSGEGKTFLLEKVSDLFPKQNVTKISTASAQAFKYGLGKTVIEEKGKFVSLNEKLQVIDAKLDKQNNEYKNHYEKAKKSLEKKSWNLINIAESWLVFLDAQDPKLWEFLKTILSQDTEYIKHIVTNKQNGGNKQQRIVFHGKPAVIYASAKDEYKQDLTGELETRFQTISLHASKSKYLEGNRLLAQQYGLPTPIYQQEVISDKEIGRAKSLVNSIIKTLQTYQNEKGPICNPFADKMATQFPHDVGSRSRQFERILRTCNILTLCNADKRPKIYINDKKYVVTHINDVSKTIQLMTESISMQTAKIQKFNEVIKPVILEHGTQISIEGKIKNALTAGEIVKKIETGKNSSRKKFSETYLDPLFEHGFLERELDPNNKTRYVFWVPEKFQNNDATTESTLIDVSTLDQACVRAYLDEHVVQRLDQSEYQFSSNSNIINVEKLIEQVTQTDIPVDENSFKTQNVEMSINVEN